MSKKSGSLYNKTIIWTQRQKISPNFSELNSNHVCRYTQGDCQTIWVLVSQWLEHLTYHNLHSAISVHVVQWLEHLTYQCNLTFPHTCTPYLPSLLKQVCRTAAIHLGWESTLCLKKQKWKQSIKTWGWMRVTYEGMRMDEGTIRWYVDGWGYHTMVCGWMRVRYDGMRMDESIIQGVRMDEGTIRGHEDGWGYHTMICGWVRVPYVAWGWMRVPYYGMRMGEGTIRGIRMDEGTIQGHEDGWGTIQGHEGGQGLGACGWMRVPYGACGWMNKGSPTYFASWGSLTSMSQV